VDKRIKVWTGGASFAAGAPPVYKAEEAGKPHNARPCVSTNGYALRRSRTLRSTNSPRGFRAIIVDVDNTLVG